MSLPPCRPPTYRWRTGLLLVLAPAALATAQPVTLTLEQALAAVESSNLDVLLGREAITQAAEAANQQRAGLLPNVSASAAQRRTKSVAASGTSGALASTPPSNRFDGLLSGSFGLLNPQQIAAYRAARAGVGVAQADYAATRQAVLATVAQTYFTHLRNVHRIGVLDANVTRAQSLLDLARNQFEAGVATKIDVTRAQALLAQAQQARLQQDTVVYQSAQLLQRQLDLDPARPLQLADFNVRRANAADPAAGLERTAFEQRADWLRAQKAVEQSRLDVQTATFERLPVLALSGQYGYAAGEFDDGTHQTEWFAGATLSLPVFDGLKSSADRRIALSRQRGQELRQHNLGLQIAAEIRLALQAAGSRFQQIAMAETSQRLAEEELRLAQQRYEQGVADNREVIDAQNSLAVASDNLNEAVYQYNLSRVEYARVQGDVRGILAEKLE